MMEHTFRGKMNWAVLLSGDKDFTPLVESLIGFGLFVEVAGDKNHISQDLIHAADSKRNLSFNDYHQWTVEKMKVTKEIDFPHITFQPSWQLDLVKRGLWKNKEMFLYRHKDSNKFYLTSPLTDKAAFEHADFQKLELYFELQFGKIDWE